MEDILSDIESKCRVCLSSGQNFLDIFLDFNDFNPYSNTALKIMECAPVKISENDGLPRLICPECIKKLFSSLLFRNLCIETDKKLQFYANKFKSKTVEEKSDIVNFNLLIRDHDYENNEHSKTNSKYLDDENENNINNIIIKEEPLDEYYEEIDNVPDNYFIADEDICYPETTLSIKEEIEETIITDNIVETDQFESESQNQNKTLEADKLLNFEIITLDSENLQYECNVCKRKFKYLNSYKRHFLIHSDTKHYQCTVCNKSYKHQQSLTTHKRVHTNDAPYKCHICKKAFMQLNHLKWHGLNYHSNLNHFECSFCNKKFKHTHGLKLHIRIHNNEEMFQCPVCKKMFSRMQTLKKHESIHTNLKPYECSVCKKAFRLRQMLTEHERIHKNLRPYKCTQCPKSFKQTGQLNRHAMIHSTYKPFECVICKMKFRDIMALQMHKLKHSEEKPWIINSKMESITS